MMSSDSGARRTNLGTPASAGPGRQTLLLMAAAVLVVCGCAATPSEHFYTLATPTPPSASAGTSEMPAAPQAVSMPENSRAGQHAPATRMLVTPPNFFIEVTAINVPPQVNRNQLVVTSGSGRVELLEQRRWAAPVAAEIGRALSLGLTGELGVIDVFRTPYPEKSMVYRVSANVQRFESALGKHALQDTVWSVRQVGGSMLSTCRSVIEQPVGPGYDALVAGHARAVAQLSSSIAATIRSMAAGITPACPS